MPRDRIAENVYYDVPGVAIVRWDVPSQCAHIEWQGWARPQEFRSANDALVDAIKDHRGSRLLGDTTKIKAIQKSDQDWVNGDWFPRILAAGATRMALVVPASGLAKMNIDDMVGRVADRLDVAYFATIDEARDWLARPIPHEVRSAQS
ncbi:MAG TPA: STAS/SEC14 domain-containing protein [Candidatus Dormibacteraeota bacterium]